MAKKVVFMKRVIGEIKNIEQFHLKRKKVQGFIKAICYLLFLNFSKL